MVSRGDGIKYFSRAGCNSTHKNIYLEKKTKMRELKYPIVFPMHLSAEQHDALRKRAKALSEQRNVKVTMAQVVREFIETL